VLPAQASHGNITVWSHLKICVFSYPIKREEKFDSPYPQSNTAVSGLPYEFRPMLLQFVHGLIDNDKTTVASSKFKISVQNSYAICDQNG